MAASLFAFVFALCINVLLADDPDCISPLESGPCYADFENYGFNPNSGSCEKFTYGGCAGNGNRYATEDDCIKACLPKPDCRSQLVTGPCRASIPRFGFNKASGTCEPFTYGGCGGNNNRYETLEECQDTCESNC